MPTQMDPDYGLTPTQAKLIKLMFIEMFEERLAPLRAQVEGLEEPVRDALGDPKDDRVPGYLKTMLQDLSKKVDAGNNLQASNWAESRRDKADMEAMDVRNVAHLERLDKRMDAVEKAAVVVAASAEDVVTAKNGFEHFADVQSIDKDAPVLVAFFRSAAWSKWQPLVVSIVSSLLALTAVYLNNAQINAKLDYNHAHPSNAIQDIHNAVVPKSPEVAPSHSDHPVTGP